MRLYLLNVLFFLHAILAFPLPEPAKNPTPRLIRPNISHKVLQTDYGRIASRPQAKKKCKACLGKRTPGPIQQAVTFLQDRKPMGKGSSGSAWRIKFQGNIDAVIKQITITPEAERHKSKEKDWNTPEKVRNEAVCLKATGQFLGWGRTNDGHDYYLVMRYMGVSDDTAMRAGMPDKELGSAIKQAKKRYSSQFHVTNGDDWIGNFVFHKNTHNTWIAEMIDWGQGQYTGTAPMDPGEPEIVAKELKKPEDPGCCIQ